jgi:hypothetical protein
MFLVIKKTKLNLCLKVFEDLVKLNEFFLLNYLLFFRCHHLYYRYKKLRFPNVHIYLMLK